EIGHEVPVHLENLRELETLPGVFVDRLADDLPRVSALFKLQAAVARRHCVPVSQAGVDLAPGRTPSVGEREGAFDRSRPIARLARQARGEGERALVTVCAVQE